MEENNIQNPVEKFYKDSLKKEDIELLNSLKAEPVYIEANYYASNLKKMGFLVLSENKDIKFSGENLRTYSKDYSIIEKDGKYGLASLVSPEIYLMCEYDEIKKSYGFKFKAFILKKNEYKYIYNFEKKSIIAKIKAESVVDVMDGSNILVLCDKKYGIYDLLKNKYSANPEYQDILFYDEKVAAFIKDNIITIFNYVNSKVMLQYKASSDEYFIEDKDESSSNVFVINKNTEYGLIDIFTGEFLVPPEYDKISFVRCFGKNNVALLEKKQKYGLYNISSKEFVLQCICDEIKLSRNHLRNYIFTFSIDGKLGFCSDKNVIASNTFDSILVTDERGFYIVCKTCEKCYIYNNKEYLFSLDNNYKFNIVKSELKKGIFKGTLFNEKQFLCIDIFDRNTLIDKVIKLEIVYSLLNDNGYIVKENDDKYYIYKNDSDDIYASILKEKYLSEIGKINDDYFFYVKNKKYGIADNEGNILTDAKYDKVLLNNSGIIECEYNGLKGYFDKKIKKVSLLKYDKLIKIEDSNAYIIAYKEGKCGVISFNSTIIPFDYEIIVKLNSQKCDRLKKYFDNVDLLNQAKYLVREKGKYTLLNINGYVISEYIFINDDSILNI